MAGVNLAEGACMHHRCSDCAECFSTSCRWASGCASLVSKKSVVCSTAGGASLARDHGVATPLDFLLNPGPLDMLMRLFLCVCVRAGVVRECACVLCVQVTMRRPSTCGLARTAPTRC